MKEHIIKFVEAGSIAEELEIEVGDVLLSINNEEIEDIFDYRFLIKDEYLEAVIRKQNGEEWLLEIEKDYYPYTWLFRLPEMYHHRAPGITCLNACKSFIQCKEVVNNINTLIDSTPLCPTDVYSVTGVRVGNTDEINALPSGIYYTCGKKILVK